MRQFTFLSSLRSACFIAWNSDQLSRKVSWTAPNQPGLVRFWLVLRDFRGGSAFVERAVCVR